MQMTSGVAIALVLVGISSLTLITACGEEASTTAAPVSATSSTAELSDAEITVRFRKIWFQDAIEHGVMINKYLGILTWQNPFDVWITQEIMFEVKPDVIVETGTFRGGSAALWATFLTQINPQGRVITIDIEDKRDEAAKNLPIVKRMVTFLLGSSSGPEVVEQVRKALVGKRALFILDSAHTREHVLSELRAYGDMVPVGSYIIVQDTIGTGAYAGIQEFLQETDAFEHDQSRERLMISNNTGREIETRHPSWTTRRIDRSHTNPRSTACVPSPCCR
ncbi:MAG: class I SAM-dependent methyltransferase [Deltaproteobacteria bacterium]|nr:class I SAM-dependent methyltransferase [Deltaproteobacteria bacterium]